MDEATKKGLGNLEKTIKAEELAVNEKKGSHVETVKSEKIRYQNADRIYE